MRIVPQILRHYLVFNASRSMDVSNMLDHCDNYPQLLHCKRMLLHDKAQGIREIERTIDDLADKRFHFLYLNRREQGINYDPCRTFEEDLAGTHYTNWELIKVCRELRMWLDHQPAYHYPCELNS